jgi:hypothetical protein
VHGFLLRLQHTGSSGPILLDDLSQGTDGPSGYLKDGAVYINVNGFTLLTPTTRVLRSLENGKIGRHILAGRLTATFEVGTGIRAALETGVVCQTMRLPLAVLANTTIEENGWASCAMNIESVQVMAVTAPLTAGFYRMELTGGGHNLLANQHFDLTSLVSGVVSTPALTLTTAHLRLSALDPLVLRLTSDNADLTGAGLSVQILYR